MSTKFGTAIAKGENSLKVGEEAARKAMEKIGDGKVDFSLVFASSQYDYRSVVKGVRKVTGNAPLIGCSTAGEFNEERVEKGSVVCGLIASDSHRFFTGLGRGLRRDEIATLQEAAAGLPSIVEGYPHLCDCSRGWPGRQR